MSAKKKKAFVYIPPAYDYIGRKSCGCIVAVCADAPGLEKHTAKSIAEFIRDGLTIERIPITELSNYLPIGCKCKAKERKVEIQEELFK